MCQNKLGFFFHYKKAMWDAQQHEKNKNIFSASCGTYTFEINTKRRFDFQSFLLAHKPGVFPSANKVTEQEHKISFALPSIASQKHPTDLIT